MPISGWLQWAKKKRLKFHFPPQAAAYPTPQDTGKASTQEWMHTSIYKHTSFLMWVDCRLLTSLQGQTKLGQHIVQGGDQVKISVTGLPLQPRHCTHSHILQTRDSCGWGIIWYRYSPETNPIWCHLSLGLRSYCACLTEYRCRVPFCHPVFRHFVK